MPGRGGPTKNFFLPLSRVHIQADRWQDSVGTDYWMHPALLAGTTVAGSNRLIDNGWTLEAEHGVAGSAGDFRGGAITAGVPTTPGVGPHFAFLATGDIVASPPIFGSYDHMWAAARCIGRDQLPTKLVLEARAQFNVASSDEPTSGFGLFEDATTTTTATEGLQLAFISSNSANFELNTNASTTLTSVGAAITTTVKTFRIEMKYDSAGVAKAYWYIDGALQGSITPTTGEAPYAFGAHTLTNNRLKLGVTHIYYDWGS